MRQRPLGALGALVILIMFLAAALAGVAAPFDPLAPDYAAMLQAPSSVHWLGTDSYGRDVLTLILYGACTALWIGFASAFLGATLGAIVGVGSAYFGGRVDLLLQRFMDLLLSFPLIILALVVVSVLGSGTGNVILAITVPNNERIELPPAEAWGLRFDGLYPEGVEVTFEFSQPDAIQVLLVEEMTGLPSFPGLSLQPEPGTMQGPGEFYQGVPADFSAIYREL